MDRRAWQATVHRVAKRHKGGAKHTEAPRDKYEHLPKENSLAMKTSAISHQELRKKQSTTALGGSVLFFLIRVDNKIAYQLCLH